MTLSRGHAMAAPQPGTSGEGRVCGVQQMQLQTSRRARATGTSWCCFLGLLLVSRADADHVELPDGSKLEGTITEIRKSDREF